MNVLKGCCKCAHVTVFIISRRYCPCERLSRMSFTAPETQTVCAMPVKRPAQSNANFCIAKPAMCAKTGRMVTLGGVVQAMTFHPGAGNSQKRMKTPLSHEAWGGFNSNAVIEAAKQCIKPDGVPPPSLDISKACAQHSGASQSIDGVSSVPVSGIAETCWKMELAGSTSASAKSTGASMPADARCAALQQRARPYQGLFPFKADVAASAASCSDAATASAWLAASSGSDVIAEQVLDLLLERDGTVVGQSSAVLPSSKAASPQASSTLLAALMQPSAKVVEDATQQYSKATAAALPMGNSATSGKCSVIQSEQGRGHGLGKRYASDSHKFLALLAGG